MNRAIVFHGIIVASHTCTAKLMATLKRCNTYKHWLLAEKPFVMHAINNI